MHIQPAVEGCILDYHTKEEYRPRQSRAIFFTEAVVFLTEGWCIQIHHPLLKYALPELDEDGMYNQNDSPSQTNQKRRILYEIFYIML